MSIINERIINEINSIADTNSDAASGQRLRDLKGRFVRTMNRLDPLADAPVPYIEPALETKPLHLCRRYQCHRTAATASGDCLLCADVDRKAAEVVQAAEAVKSRWAYAFMAATVLMLIWAVWGSGR